jgi:hypothetical protein
VEDSARFLRYRRQYTREACARTGIDIDHNGLQNLHVGLMSLEPLVALSLHSVDDCSSCNFSIWPFCWHAF